MFYKEYSIENWMSLYDSCYSIHDMKPLISKDYSAFISKSTSSNPIKLGQTSKMLSLIPKQKQYYHFFQKNDLFWMIPIELPDCSIIGFILKNFVGEKSYLNVSFSDFHTFFGLYDFNDFKKQSLIILTEGSKDSLFVKQYYKYTLALTTSGLTSTTLAIVKSLTNKILLLYDNDDTGYLKVNSDSIQLKYHNMIPLTMKYQLKDPGEYFLSSEYHKLLFQNSLNSIINNFR